jgi:hypothetical protein
MHTLLKKAKKRQAAVGIPEEVCQDLMLMDRVIKQANKGVDMNNLTNRLPNVVFKNDACPFGIGGYNIMGNSWRWIIPPELRFRATNNLLEHLTNIASKKWGLLIGRIKKGDCVLTMSDSMVSTSWLRKSNFDEDPDNLAEEDTEVARVNAEVRKEVLSHFKIVQLTNEIVSWLTSVLQKLPVREQPSSGVGQMV